MQSAAPELIDLSGETQATLDDVRRRPRGAGRRRRAAAAARASSAPFATQLPAGPPAGRARRAVRQPLSTPRGTTTRTSTPSCRSTAGMADQPIAALLKDLKQRGLLDETLVRLGQRVRPHAAGREPRRLAKASPAATTTRSPSRIWMAGGGIKGGQVYRQDRRDRLERRRGPGPRQRLPRHDPAPVRPRPPEADLPLPGPRLPPDRRRRQGGATSCWRERDELRLAAAASSTKASPAPLAPRGASRRRVDGRGGETMTNRGQRREPSGRRRGRISRKGRNSRFASRGAMPGP